MKRTAARRALLAQAKALFPRAHAGDFDAAAVLGDVVLQLDEWEGEKLAHALRGRSFPAGGLLPPDAAARNLKNVLLWAERGVFPPRRSPCMPSRRDFLRLVSVTLDMSEPVGRRMARALWKALEEACSTGSWRAIARALSLANDTIQGHGVEQFQIRTRRGGVGVFDYVNIGETYTETLVFDLQATRFWVASWGDIVERFEVISRRP